MPRGVVLNFHRELDGSVFEEGILAVKKRYRIVSLPELHELLANKKSVKNIAHISFDDGEMSFYENVFPVLKKHGLPVSLFVSPKIIETVANFWFQDYESFKEEDLMKFISQYKGVPAENFAGYNTLSILKSLRVDEIIDIIGAYKSFHKLEELPRLNMNLEQLLEVDRSGLVTVGAHTQDHPILMNETDERSWYEISESVEHLQRLLNHPVEYFAFPNGVEGYDFSEREISYLKNAGILLAFSTHSDHLTNMSSIYKVPRVYYATTLGLKPSHPFIMWRLALGNRWPRFRKRVSETDMRDAVSRILTEKKGMVRENDEIKNL